MGVLDFAAATGRYNEDAASSAGMVMESLCFSKKIMLWKMLAKTKKPHQTAMKTTIPVLSCKVYDTNTVNHENITVNLE